MKNKKVWVNIMDYPELEGNVEISIKEKIIFIGGNPKGLRSLSNILCWLADYNQEKDANLPKRARKHIHLEPGDDLSLNSAYVEICRLDPKGEKRVSRQLKKRIK